MRAKKKESKLKRGVKEGRKEIRKRERQIR